jgi:hypothetical protein
MLDKAKIYPKQVTSGRYLARIRRDRNKSARAGVAAMIVRGELVLERPLVAHVSTLLGVSPAYTHRALRASDAERRALAYGQLSISHLQSLSRRQSPSEKLVRDWFSTSKKGRIEFAQRVGASAIWDDAVAPIVS